MTVPSVTPAAGASPQPTRNRTDLDYDAFLRLLIAQMKSQDPMNPMDPAQSMSQFAQFSQVEQSIKINKKLDTLHNSLSIGSAEGLIGRMLTAPDGTTGTVTSVKITAEGRSAKLDTGKEVQITDGVSVS
ncbi:flagellar hook assembly protein FlgD [Chthonobacter rhizosphaerae]|uniref:flagellar hook assembly protein FlgD n=1 Tax=Chthonobacter rhizosphaerae TaxID=2735553 RepID=UPI0015EEB763|nr:flagellar hook assembly protein FlgD [Chthonobacter rhizosphaerae]